MKPNLSNLGADIKKLRAVTGSGMQQKAAHFDLRAWRSYGRENVPWAAFSQ